jgi:hypothetical protein
VEDIRTSTDLIAPRRPAELLPPLPRGRRPNHPGRDGRVASLSSKRASETPESSPPTGYDRLTEPTLGVREGVGCSPHRAPDLSDVWTQVAALRVESVVDGLTHGRPIRAD